MQKTFSHKLPSSPQFSALRGVLKSKAGTILAKNARVTATRATTAAVSVNASIKERKGLG
jgi:hypothetical protein